MEKQPSLKIRLIPPNTFSAERIKYIRKNHHLTQKAFAILLGVSCPTVESWEQGLYTPKGSSSRLLELLETHQVEIIR